MLQPESTTLQPDSLTLQTPELSTFIGTFSTPLEIIDDAGLLQDNRSDLSPDSPSDVDSTQFHWAVEMMRESSTLSSGIDATGYADSESDSDVPPLHNFHSFPKIRNYHATSSHKLLPEKHPVTCLHSVFATETGDYLVVATIGGNVRSVFWDLQQLRDEISPRQFRIVQRAMQRTPFFYTNV